jgi:hypothetical protein
MNLTIDINEKNRIQLDDWGTDGSQSLQFYAKPLHDFQLVSGVLLTKEKAASLAIALLNKSGNSNMLAKKYRWES